MRCTSRQLQTLISTLEDVKLTNQDIYILYINFKNAFGLIDHVRLLGIMKDLGYPQAFKIQLNNTNINFWNKGCKDHD